jgi:ubiquinone/menaquinone biosynthesis C-methylase UbiE
MAIRMDPQQNEVRALRAATRWRGLRVLEIGCGDGRLTLRLARMGALVDAIDPDAASIRQARRQLREHLPPRLARHVQVRVGAAEHLDFPDNHFDRVLFAWSLC